MVQEGEEFNKTFYYVNCLFPSKLNDLEFKKKEIEIEIAGVEVDQGTEDKVTGERVRMMFSNLKEYVKTRNIPE